MAVTASFQSAKVLIAGFVLALGISFLFSALVTADGASAQSPSFCEQYPNDPECDDGGPGPGGNEGENPDAGPAAGAGPVSGAAIGGATGGGELPFTGYPLSPLLILLLVLLASGLALRGYLAVRDRLAARSPLD